VAHRQDDNLKVAELDVIPAPVSLVLSISEGRVVPYMAKPNYSFEKRKREMDKKAKKAEKAKRKAEGKPEEGDEETTPTGDTETTPPAENP
jgi:hypothetical protein